MNRQNQESPLRKSLEKIDSMLSLAKNSSSVYTPKKQTSNIQSRPISAQRYPSKQGQQSLFSNGFSTPLRNGSSTNFKSISNSKQMRGSSLNSSQAKHMQQSKKSITNLNSSSNGFQNYSSLIEMSPSKRGVQHTTQSVLFHTNISGTHVKYTENAADKTSITKLGLKLQPICIKGGHDRSKISYVCTDLHCQNQQKFGCAHCFLEDHGEHAIRKLRIDDFVNSIEFKYQQYMDSVCNLANLANMMHNPAFQKNILIKLDKLKEEFIQRVDIIKEKVQSIIQEEISQDNFIIENEVDKQQAYLQQLKKAMQKNIFEMSDDEFGYALNIHHDTFATDLLKRTKVIQDRYNDLENKYNQNFSLMHEKLNEELDKILTTFTDLDINDENLNNFQFNSQFLINSNSPINIQRASSQIDYSTQISKNTDNEERMKHAKKQEKSEQLEKKEGDQQHLTSLLAKKESHENILKNNVKLIEELQTVQRDINYLTIKNHFPYKVYQDGCPHSIKCNTVPIFECCKQAYQCTICHDQQSNHKHLMTNPSKRYCMKCFKVFNVKYYTNIAINCKDCLTVKIKK
ncbi:hypothetical protein ABPG72_016915 [Tetrahymena utriculariae]